MGKIHEVVEAVLGNSLIITVATRPFINKLLILSRDLSVLSIWNKVPIYVAYHGAASSVWCIRQAHRSLHCGSFMECKYNESSHCIYSETSC